MLLNSARADDVTLTPVGTYETGIFDEGASEIVDYDPVTQRIYVVNADAGEIDMAGMKPWGKSCKSTPTSMDR
ncbi:MAG: hypothetical protein F6K19_50335 [Cyanothece sp. SIO1E1]|nr:hypothetical protein [Cyanothece sp. SIO1E1]